MYDAFFIIVLCVVDFAFFVVVVDRGFNPPTQKKTFFRLVKRKQTAENCRTPKCVATINQATMTLKNTRCEQRNLAISGKSRLLSA